MSYLELSTGCTFCCNVLFQGPFMAHIVKRTVGWLRIKVEPHFGKTPDIPMNKGEKNWSLLCSEIICLGSGGGMVMSRSYFTTVPIGVTLMGTRLHQDLHGLRLLRWCSVNAWNVVCKSPNILHLILIHSFCWMLKLVYSLPKHRKFSL